MKLGELMGKKKRKKVGMEKRKRKMKTEGPLRL